MKDFVVRKQISIEAGNAKVWDALTNPELTKKYFFNCRVLSTWIVGDPIVFKGKVLGLIPIKLSGKILAMDRGKMLQYSLENRDSSGESIVTDMLREENGKTILSITDNVGQGKNAVKRYRKSVTGWDKVLKGLKKIAEAQ